MKWQVVFTIKNGFHPFTEYVEAASVEQAKEVVHQMVKAEGLTLKQIVLVLQTERK